MGEKPQIEKYINDIVKKCSNREELKQISISSIIQSLKKMTVLSKSAEKEILRRKSIMGEIQLLTLGIKIEMINTEIEKIRREFLS